jgi:hypothetical protein
MTLTQIRNALHQQLAKLDSVVDALAGIEADIDALISPPPPIIRISARGCYATMAYSGGSFAGGPV